MYSNKRSEKQGKGQVIKRNIKKAPKSDFKIDKDVKYLKK